MSRQGTDLGGDFCPRNGLIFDEVLSLTSTSELADYAAGKDLVPASMEVCPAAGASTSGSTKTASKKHH